MSDEEREKDEKLAAKMQQMQLALEGETLLIDYSELPTRYTGERLKARYPQRYKAAITLIALGEENCSDHEIGKFIHADQRVITALRLSQIKDIDEQRERMKQKCFVNAMLCQDKATELVDSCTKLNEVSISGGIWADKWMQLSGTPTANIRVEHKIDFEGLFANLRKQAEETMKAVQAQVIDPPALPEGEPA